MRIILIVLLLSSNAYASIEVKHSIGIGAQHAAIGYQIALNSEKNSIYGAFGPSILAAGYQRFLDSEYRHSLGVTAGGAIDILSGLLRFFGATYNFYPQSRSESGFILGLTAGKYRIISESSDNFISMEFGIQF